MDFSHALNFVSIFRTLSQIGAVWQILFLSLLYILTLLSLSSLVLASTALSHLVSPVSQMESSLPATLLSLNLCEYLS